MFVQKNYTLKGVFAFTGWHLVWLAAWSILVAGLYKFANLQWLSIPWLPVSLIGTAVAFYVGFKNNQAYDRLWEARKIWGAIINSSRTWGISVKSYIGNQFTENKLSETQLLAHKKVLIYEHIGWLYTLREQLLAPTMWEHVSLKGQFGKVGRKRAKEYGLGLFDENITEEHLKKYLSSQAYSELDSYKNAATQLIALQAERLTMLREENLIDDFRHVELQKLLSDFYDHQGKVERIKKFPLPRQYGSMSFIFVCIFVFMLPFGMVSEFSKLGTWGVWLSIPFCTMVGWVYVVMELIGDYTENPFEGLDNDVPMFSICRTIEIDLLQMLGEKTLPPPISPINGILM